MTKIVEEIILSFVLLYRIARRQLRPRIAWWLADTWWPFKKARRLRAKWRIWRAKQYHGNNEFHPRLNLDVVAMIELNSNEQSRYVNDLIQRRERAHLSSLR